MTQRLPIPGEDDNVWGDVLNGFLGVAHAADGSLLSSAITAAGAYTKPSGGIPSSDLSSAVQTAIANANSAAQPSTALMHDLSGTIATPTVTGIQNIPVNNTAPSSGQVLSYNGTQWVPGTVTSTTISDATSSSKGILELSGDLSGTASSPTVTGTHLTSALPVNQGGTGSASQNFVDLTTSQTIAGTKTFSSTIAGSISGNAATASLANTVTTNANLTGDITSVGNTTTLTSSANVESIIASNTTVAGKAPLASPTFTGTITTPALKVTGGTLASGNVLTSDASGNATWQAAVQNLTASTVVVSSASPFSAAAGSFIPVDTSGGNVTVTLPSAPADGTRVAIKMINTTGTNAVTVNASGGDVFNKAGGSTSGTLSLLNQGMMLQYAASTAIWYVQADDLPLSQLDTRYPLNSATPGGDLAGTYAAPTVAKIQGITISGSPATGQAILATSTSTAAWTQREFNVMAFGAKGDGSHDDTTAINNCLTAAAAVNGEVYFPPAPGGCYRTSGITVPGSVSRIYGSADLYRSNGPSPVYLNGSVLAPTSSSVTALMTIGVSGSGTVVNSNPHGLRVEGIGFLGTVPAGTAVSGMWGVVVTDTSDVTLAYCRDLFCDPKSSVLGGGPSGGTATGGFAQILSSASGNGFSENARLLFCASYGAGTFVYVDGLVTSAGGSTDGRMIGCQLNTHYNGVQLGPAKAGCGGWAILECHFSSSNALNHISYGGTNGTPWTLRVEACYFDVVGTYHITANTGRGLMAVGNYFRSNGNVVAINFTSNLATTGRDPAALITGNTFDLNKTTGTVGFVRFQGFTAANFATNGGGEYRTNLVHNHGSAMPVAWVGQFIGSDNLAITSTSTATLDLSVGPVLSA